MQLHQSQIDALEKWIEDRRNAYLVKGFSLAANSGVSELAEFALAPGLSEEDAKKSLADLKAELDSAEDFYRDARQFLYAGRQGG
ncbi:hypothetical protein GUA87_08950 [Sneathiella sp. P13V-1]|uniref:hypothetical protein n=1 Tax=Sneathiella sp. P13V-1 TaxID=2697366 RepID=UPI00187BBCAC|nr:hypothetical protein [Sneathiella sp. P13V-1]MBE7636969.1 hypothetical protein [Sneathiella sp. P13V-1]